MVAVLQEEGLCVLDLTLCHVNPLVPSGHSHLDCTVQTPSMHVEKERLLVLRAGCSNRPEDLRAVSGQIAALTWGCGILGLLALFPATLLPPGYRQICSVEPSLWLWLFLGEKLHSPACFSGWPRLAASKPVLSTSMPRGLMPRNTSC